MKLPADAEVSVDLDSSNGGITLSDITGGDIDLSTSNGALLFEDVTADMINGDTSNGGVRGTLEAPATYLRGFRITSGFNVFFNPPRLDL